MHACMKLDLPADLHYTMTWVLVWPGARAIAIVIARSPTCISSVRTCKRGRSHSHASVNGNEGRSPAGLAAARKGCGVARSSRSSGYDIRV
jgi:hypothetical protein